MVEQISRGVLVRGCAVLSLEFSALQPGFKLINIDLPWNQSRLEQRLGRMLHLIPVCVSGVVTWLLLLSAIS